MAAAPSHNHVPQGFGPPVLVHQPSRFWGLVGIFLVLAGITLIVLVCAGLIPIIFFFGFLLWFPGFGLAWTLLDTPYSVHPEGFVFWRLGRRQVCTWDEVQAIWCVTTTTYHGQFQSQTARHSCEIMRTDGTRLKLKDLTPDFVSWLAQETYRALAPKVRAQWEAGESVWFDYVSLSPAGIHSGKDLLPWGEVQTVAADRNESDIVIRRWRQDAPWMNLDVTDIPNAALFFQLVRENLRTPGE